jgi:DNA primase
VTDVTLEDVLMAEALDYKETSGSSGAQLCIKECPNCGNTTWDKVYANQATGAGKCFKCQETFNTWKFVKWVLIAKGGAGTARDVGQYLDALRKRMGYRPKAKPTAPVQPVAVSAGDFELPFSNPIPDIKGNNNAYLEKRGIPGEYAQKFGLRYSLFGHWDYVDPRTGEAKRQSFAERIIIPVTNLEGKIVTFQGRDVTGTSDTRYKFAATLPGTARFLYNGHTAYAHRSKHVLMNEGPTDVIKAQIALDQAADLAGIVAVGSFGMNLSSTKEGDDQVGAFAKLKARGLETVTIMWDGEEEAFSNALAAAELLIKIGLNVRIATLPVPTEDEKTNGVKSHDPGSVDAIVIQRAIRDAVPVTRMSLLRMRMNNPYRSR